MKPTPWKDSHVHSGVLVGVTLVSTLLLTTCNNRNEIKYKALRAHFLNYILIESLLSLPITHSHVLMLQHCVLTMDAL